MVGLWTWDPATDEVTWSDGVAQLHGVATAATTYAELLAAVHPADRAAVDDDWRGLALDGGESGAGYRGTDGRFLSAHAQRVEVGGRRLVVGTVEPGSRAVRDERRFRDLFRHFPVGMAMLGDDGLFVEVNDAFAGLLGRPREELLGASFETIVHPEELSAATANRQRIANGHADAAQAERRLVRRDGTVFWGRVVVTRLEDDTGAVWLASLEDISDRKQAEERLLMLALHDPLTGLPNRRLLLDRLERALARSRRAGRDVAVLFLDLDHVKRINDSLGHDAGDELLATIARNVAEVVRTTDTVARLGGDEFVVVCEQVADLAELEQLAERVLEAVRLPVDLGGERVVVTASIGVVLASSQDDSPQDLLRSADAAMYVAKNGGRARYVIEQSEAVLDGGSRLALESALRLAVEAGELVLHYQPIVRVDGTVDSLEALLRWQHPTRGLLLPEEFLGVSGTAELGRAVTSWVVRQATTDAAGWGNEAVGVSVNVPVDQLREPAFADRVLAWLDEAGLAAGRLRIELLEDQLADTESIGGTVLRLAKAGVTFAVDDFGTGYASLAYLKRLPIGIVKIDRSFIATLCDDAADAAIVRAVLEACRATERVSVAEGVETPEQLALLRLLDCQAVQGKLVGSPAPLLDLLPLVLAGRVDLDAEQPMAQA